MKGKENMMLNSTECTFVAAAYAHRLVKERMESADKELRELIHQIVERRVSSEILKLVQQYAENIVPTPYLRFISSESKEVMEVVNPSELIPRLKEIRVSEEEFKAIKLARHKSYNVANLQSNLTSRIEDLLRQAGDIETIAEIMPEIMPVLEETICTKDDDGSSILKRKLQLKKAYQEFKKYMELNINNPSCL